MAAQFLALLGQLFGSAGGASAAGSAAGASAGAAAAGAGTAATAGTTAAASVGGASSGVGIADALKGLDFSKISTDSLTALAPQGNASNTNVLAQIGQSMSDGVKVATPDFMNSMPVNREGAKEASGTAQGINRKYNGLAKSAAKLADFDKDTPPFMDLKRILRLTGA